MSERNDRRAPAEQALDQARRAHGRRCPAAAAAADRYGSELAERITAQQEQGAERTQQRWDRCGTPMWMRIKTALGLGGRCG